MVSRPAGRKAARVGSDRRYSNIEYGECQPLARRSFPFYRVARCPNIFFGRVHGDDAARRKYQALAVGLLDRVVNLRPNLLGSAARESAPLFDPARERAVK